MLKIILALAMLTSQQAEYVRVTYYHLGGTMADGVPVHWGAAACSSGRPGSGALAFAQGTVLELPDGYDVTCEDTGNGDYYWKAWIDIWTPAGTLGYNDYEWVSIIRWGWTDVDQ